MNFNTNFSLKRAIFSFLIMPQSCNPEFYHVSDPVSRRRFLFLALFLSWAVSKFSPAIFIRYPAKTLGKNIEDSTSIQQ
jgi:hypothetical protein